MTLPNRRAESASRPRQPGSDEPPPQPVPGQDDPDPQPIEPPDPSPDDEPPRFQPMAMSVDSDVR